MERIYVVDKTFDKTDLTANKRLSIGDYENCRFLNCDLGSTDISGMHFIDCEFKNCNLSAAKLIKTVIRDVRFIECKLMGLQFDSCDPFLFSASFEKCILDLSSFNKFKLKKIVFRNCNLQEVDFSEADLSESVFDHCNLTRTLFSNTLLEKADFRTSFNYSIDPESNRVRNARFSLQGIAGLLDKYELDIE